MPDRRLAAVAAVAVVFLAAAPAGSVAASRQELHTVRPAETNCTASVVHPLSVRVTALDRIARGADVRLRVTASSRIGLEHAIVRMISTGGATNRGPSTQDLGALAPGRDAATDFTLALPPSGNRFYVQLQVVGQGPQGPLSRGACYNMLPDGPLQTGRLVVTPQGNRVMQVAARRIGQ